MSAREEVTLELVTDANHVPSAGSLVIHRLYHDISLLV